MQAINRRRAIVATSAGLASGLSFAPARSTTNAGATTPARLDALVERFRVACEVPGLAVALVRPNEAPFAKGYGVRDIGRSAPVDAGTVFGIASNTKAFTAAALAMLVDEAKLGWDTPVVRLLPEFAMADPAATPTITLRDLLTHRTGLPALAGDLINYPATTHSAEDTLRVFAHLKPASPPRTVFAYDNLTYIVARLIVERTTSMPWRDFVMTRILRPLGMRASVASPVQLTNDNLAGHHGRRGPPVSGVGPLVHVQPHGASGAFDGACGVHTSASDIVPWLQVQLARGLAPSGQRLWSEAQGGEMQRPQIIMTSTRGARADDRPIPVMRAYGLGWQIEDYRGQALVFHGGGDPGQISRVGIVPASGLGVAVFTNAEDDLLPQTLMYAIIDECLGENSVDWLQIQTDALQRRAKRRLEQAKAIPASPPTGGPSLPPKAYVGVFRDPWYGDVTILWRDGGLFVDFVATPALKGPLEVWGSDTFRAKFRSEGVEDALLTFVVEGGRIQQVKVRAFSPMADASFDYQHLDLRPTLDPKDRRSG